MPSLKDGSKPHDYDFDGAGAAGTRTLSGNVTLVDTDGALQYMDANGANRDVTLPAVSTFNHPFVIVNTSGAAYNLVVKNAGGSTIITVGQNQIGLLWSNGVNWVGALNQGNVPAAASSNYLAGDVTMTNANQFYDGPSLSLAAGTWVVGGAVDVLNSGGSSKITAKLWNGTTAYASVTSGGFAGEDRSVAIPPVPIVLAAPATVKISAASTGGSSSIKAAVVTNGAGNTASYITALKIG